MHQFAVRIWTGAAVVLLGAGALGVTPAVHRLPDTRVLDVALASGTQLVLDLVRHGESTDNASSPPILGTTPPGAPLTALGEQQAIAVGNSLYNGGDNGIDGVWASQFLRAQQTAWPLVQLLAGHPCGTGDCAIPPGPDTPIPGIDPTQVLSGLNELDAGILRGHDASTLNGLLYMLAPIMWMFGQYWVPQLFSTVDPNGMAFENRFGGAVDTIYNAGGATTDGQLHDVAFAHAASIATWVMMNVKNPDFGLFFSELTKGILPNTGQVVIEGSPTDGWTLVSYAGTAVAADPGLLTSLFVSFRDLITAPQMAVWNLFESIFGGGSADVVGALQQSVEEVGAAAAQFPEAVLHDFLGALGAGPLTLEPGPVIPDLPAAA